MRRILDDRDKTELQGDLKQYKDDMAAAQAQLKTEIDTEDARLQSEIDSNVAQLTRDIGDVNTSLSNKIQTTQTTLQANINSVQTTAANNLNDYKSAMTTKHTEMQTAMNSADQQLQNNLNAVELALQNMITTTKNELQANINSSSSTQADYTDQAVANLINGSPEALDALNELAAALGNDPNFATTMATQLGTKVDKDGNKVLTDNNLTDALKANYDAAYSHSQVAHAPSDAEKNVQADWNATDTTSDAYINNKPTALKNPSTLTFNGTVSATYDGSEPITITINDASIVYMQIADGYVQYSNDNKTWVNLFALSEITAAALSVDENGILVLA